MQSLELYLAILSIAGTVAGSSWGLARKLGSVERSLDRLHDRVRHLELAVGLEPHDYRPPPPPASGRLAAHKAG